MFDPKIQQAKTVVGWWQSSLLMVLRGMKSLIYHVLTGRWFMLFTSWLIMAAAGAAYMFVMYSNEVKTSLGYDQSTLNMLSFFKDVGATIGIISGLENKITPPSVYFTCLCGFLMVLIIIQNKLSFKRTEYIPSGLVVFFFLLLPLVVVFKEELNLNQLKVVTEVPPPNGALSQQEVVATITCLGNILKPPKRREDSTILQALCSIDLLILFAATTFGAGGALTAIDIWDRLDTHRDTQVRALQHVSLLSIWNYLGRVIAGYASEIFLTKYKFPRPCMLTLVVFLSCVGHILIALGIPNSLYFSSVIIGFCLGAQWPRMFAIISEIFGLKYYSTLYNFGAVASPVGSYILNVRLTGVLYDKEGLKQLKAKGFTRQVGQDLTCVGVQCYRMVFIIITAAILLGVLFRLFWC